MPSSSEKKAKQKEVAHKGGDAMSDSTLHTISVELRKLEAEQLENVTGTSLIPNVGNNILAVQHDVEKKAFAVIVENSTKISTDDKPAFSIKMAYLGIFTYSGKVNDAEFLELICHASETMYNVAILQKILELTIAFGIAPLRAYIKSITPDQIAGVHIEKTTLAITLPEMPTE